MKEIEILNYVHDTLHSTFFDIVSYVCEYAFKIEFIWIVVALFLMRNKNLRPFACALVFSLFIEMCICYLTKFITDAPRPFEVYPDVDTLFTSFHFSSFPSSHAAMAFTIATVVTVFYKKLGIPLIALAVVVSVTRLYSYCHFPIDVFTGAMVGIICTYLTICIFFRFCIRTVYIMDDEASD